MESEELAVPKVRSRRNSLQPIDRHKDVLDNHGSIYINAGIDSTCGIKRIKPFDNSNDDTRSNTKNSK